MGFGSTDCSGRIGSLAEGSRLSPGDAAKKARISTGVHIHIISRVGGNFHLVTVLETPQVGGNVLVSLAEGPDLA
jgi:hypothetical protein